MNSDSFLFCFVKIVFSAVKIDFLAAVEIEMLPSTIDLAVAVVNQRSYLLSTNLTWRKILSVYMVISGIFVNGPYALITTAVSATLVSNL